MDDVTEDAKKRVGRTLKSKYQLESLIGVGGMAAVYAGSHRNGHRVAIKMLHAHLSKNEQVRKENVSGMPAERQCPKYRIQHGERMSGSVTSAATLVYRSAGREAV